MLTVPSSFRNTSSAKVWRPAMLKSSDPIWTRSENTALNRPSILSKFLALTDFITGQYFLVAVVMKSWNTFLTDSIFPSFSVGLVPSPVSGGTVRSPPSACSVGSGVASGVSAASLNMSSSPWGPPSSSGLVSSDCLIRSLSWKILSPRYSFLLESVVVLYSSSSIFNSSSKNWSLLLGSFLSSSAFFLVVSSISSIASSVISSTGAPIFSLISFSPAWNTFALDAPTARSFCCLSIDVPS